MLPNVLARHSAIFSIALAGCVISLVAGCGSPSTQESARDSSRSTPTAEPSPLEPTDTPAPSEAPTDVSPPMQDAPEPTPEAEAPASSDTTPVQDDPFTDSPSDAESSTSQSPSDTTASNSPADPSMDTTGKPTLYPDPPGLKRLSPDYNLWIDPVNKEVVMVAEVVLREGGLELFACLRNTKEHEAIIAVDTQAWLVHTALLAVGAKKGEPVAFRPEYKKVTGSRVEILLAWKDPETGEQQTARAQDWTRNAKTGQAMHEHWVFGGSSFWEDETTDQRYYLAEDGDLICVANFHSAMLDVPIESTQSNDLLMYDAYTERIPPLGTEVWVRLKPVPEKSEPK